MVRMVRWLAGLALLGHPLAAQSSGALLLPLLPATTVEAELLQEWAPPRLQELAGRIQEAARADPEWFRRHVEASTPGEPLPYDARLGVTAEEYREFQALSTTLEFRPALTVPLTLARTPTGWRMPDDFAPPSLRGLEIDTVADVIRTSYGVLATRSLVEASAYQRATGRWSGPQWKLETLDPGTLTGVVATFAVGRLEATGHTLLYYNAQEAREGAVVRQAMVFLRLPAR